MKKIVIILAFVFRGLLGLAQITIDQTDMPNPGDTIRVSISTNIPGDYTKPGTDTTWDFSALFSMNQQLDSFVAIQFTPPALHYNFSNANLASPGGVPAIPGLPVSTPFTFYEKASGHFESLGSGFIINLAGIPFPAITKYDNPDEYYTFPLTTGSTWNSTSSASLGIQGLASYYTTRVRTNVVDGWGTLITPWGSFQTIRVKSHLIEMDSLYVDTIGTGIPVTRDITQYKWLAKGKGIPVLQVNEEGALSTAIYRDFYRQPVRPVTVNMGPDTAVYKGSTITIAANASDGTPPYTYIWSTFALTPSITVTVDSTTRYSVVVVDAANNGGFGTKLVTAMGQGIAERTYESLNLIPNPAHGTCQLRSLTLKHPSTLQVLSAQGFVRKEMIIDPSSPATLTIDLSDLSSGLYVLQILDGQTWYRGKLILQSHATKP